MFETYCYFLQKTLLYKQVMVMYGFYCLHKVAHVHYLMLCPWDRGLAFHCTGINSGLIFHSTSISPSITSIEIDLIKFNNIINFLLQTCIWYWYTQQHQPWVHTSRWGLALQFGSSWYKWFFFFWAKADTSDFKIWLKQCSLWLEFCDLALAKSVRFG